MTKIAVTGATGFVGGFIADCLEDRGYEVLRFGRRDMDKILSWDITKGTYPDLIKIDCVIHCAASVNDWESYKKSFDVNVTGTKNVLNSFLNVEKIIYISSASVYDLSCKRLYIKEDDCVGGIDKLLNSYSKTKLLGELEVEKSKIKSRIILRPHIIYGKGDKTIGPRILKATRFGFFPVIGNGMNRISFTNIENLSEAILSVLISENVGLHIYNITDSENFTLIEAIKQLKKINNLNFKEVYISKNTSLYISNILEFFYRLFKIKKSPILTKYIIEQLSSDHILDISKAIKDFNYNPTKNIRNDFIVKS